jgi:hypothetical protein
MLEVRVADVSLFRRLQTPVCTRLVTHTAAAATCSGNDKRLHPPHNYHHSKDHICITLYGKVMQMVLYCTLDYCIIMIDGLHEIDWDTVRAGCTCDTHCIKQIETFCCCSLLEKSCAENVSFFGRLLCGSSVKSGSDESCGFRDWKVVK